MFLVVGDGDGVNLFQCSTIYEGPYQKGLRNMTTEFIEKENKDFLIKEPFCFNIRKTKKSQMAVIKIEKCCNKICFPLYSLFSLF